MARGMTAARFRWMHVALAVALAVAPGCSGASLPTAPKVPETGSTLFTVSIVADANAVEVGQTVNLMLDGQDESGAPAPVSNATWKSSDPRIATVDTRGNVTGVKLGRVTITATTKNPAREATLTLQVVGVGQAPAGGGSFPDDTDTGSDGDLDPTFPNATPAPRPSTIRPPASTTPAPDGVAMAIYPLNTRLGVGETIRMISYQGMPGAQAPAAAMWESADETIATIDEAGVVTGRKAGAVTIIATSVAYPALVQEIVMTVVPPTTASQIQGIRITPSSITGANAMRVGETFWLLAEVPTRNGSFDANIRWVAGDPSLVEISETGQLTAKAPGRTTVTAIAATWDQGELSATIPVEILNAASSRAFKQ
jgi:uncharacterized protein YjdB